MWTDNAGLQDVYRVDLATGKDESFAPMKEIRARRAHDLRHRYRPENNVYFLVSRTAISAGSTPRPEAQLYAADRSFAAAPRRMDAQDRLWFAEYRGNHIGMLDTKTETFKEWALPTPGPAPTIAVVDKNGEIWTGGMTTDRVARLDPKTGADREYLLPQGDQHPPRLRRNTPRR